MLDHDRIEFMAMGDQDTLAIRCRVDCVLLNRDATEHPEVVAILFVVVTGDIEYSGTLPAFSKKFLDYVRGKEGSILSKIS